MTIRAKFFPPAKPVARFTRAEIDSMWAKAKKKPRPKPKRQPKRWQWLAERPPL